MPEITRIVTEHPLAAMAVCFAVLLIVYFLFKCFIKLALIFLIVAVVVGGYVYFQKPGNRPANLGEAVEKARTGTHLAVEKGKQAVQKGRDLIGKGKQTWEKGKELIDRGKEVLDRGMDQGMDRGRRIVDKGRGAADDIGAFIDGQQAGETQ